MTEKTKQKRGRPSRTETTSTHRIAVRFDDGEYKAIEAASRYLNCTISDLVRSTLFTAASIVYKNKKEDAFLEVLKKR